MSTSPKPVGLRLAFSLLALAALGGCAVYAPPPGPYSYYGTDASGQAVYGAPPVYAAPYAPYYYGPAFVGPPVSLNLGLSYWRGGGSRHGWAGRGGPGARGGWHGGGGHRGGAGGHGGAGGR